MSKDTECRLGATDHWCFTHKSYHVRDEATEATKEDLSARLRAECGYHDKLNALCGPEAPHPYCLPCEAADEIERLRSQVELCERDHYHLEIDK